MGRTPKVFPARARVLGAILAVACVGLIVVGGITFWVQRDRVMQNADTQLQGFAVFALLQRLRCCRLQPSYLERLSAEMIRPRKTSWAQQVVVSRLAAHLGALSTSSRR